jgi:hypothetical protein
MAHDDQWRGGRSARKKRLSIERLSAGYLEPIFAQLGYMHGGVPVEIEIDLQLSGVIRLTPPAGGEGEETPPPNPLPVDGEGEQEQPGQPGQPAPVALNDNPGLDGQNVIEAQPTPDGRYQFVPTLYELEWSPGSVGVPPYINRKINADGSQHAAIEITQIDGRMGYRTSLNLPAGCYLLKLVGAWSLEKANPDAALHNIAIGASLSGEGGARELGEQGLPDWISTGKHEHVFPFRVTAEQVVTVSGWLLVRWATLRGVYQLHRFEVLPVSGDYCNGAVEL